MSGVVWSKFYWADWETDPALRLCSLAAQGLWMRMLCIAAAHDPIGYVAVAGRGLDETALARLTGCQESEIASLLGELSQNGVFSRDRHGRVFSRRMVDDAKKSAIAKKNGKNGGNPTLCNNKENSASDKGSVKAPLKPQEPRAISQKEETTSLRSVEKKSRGTRLPADWTLPDEWHDYAVKQGLPITEIAREAERFRDWWLSAAGAKGVKADWFATWRNWVRSACERRGVSPPAGPITASSPDWLSRLRFVEQSGRWLDDYGDPKDIPAEYRARFAAALPDLIREAA